MSNDVLLLVFLGTIVGGAIGARMVNAPAWKGALITLVGSLCSALLLNLFNSNSQLIGFVVFLLGAGICGGALKLSGREMRMMVLGSIFVGSVFLAVGSSIA